MDNRSLEGLLQEALETPVEEILEEAPSNRESDDSGLDIAIIGVDASIGLADSPEEFWDAVWGGTDFIRDFPRERVEDAQDLHRGMVGGPMAEPVPYAYLDRVDLFDAQRHGISGAEALWMEPHQRLFLDTATRALENAGYGGDALRGTNTGVYAASGLAQGLYQAGHVPKDAPEAGLMMSGGLESIVASRISHELDLRGPAMMVHTACSSALAAMAIAVDALRSSKVQMALVGAVRLTLVPPLSDVHSFGIEAPTHRTRAFSSDAEGTGGGEGCIVMLLKPLDKALADGDHIHGVIKGIATNQDGSTTGITAPSAHAQARVIRDAWNDAGIDPLSVSYIEAHGTATELGDPVEIDGLTQAFAQHTDRRQFLPIGAVKSNIGHLDAAAGLAGVLKVLGMFERESIPPSLHFTAPNPKIAFIDSPFTVVDRLQPWESEGPRRAGVSSFGLSGTNVHVILEEPPAPTPRQDDATVHVVPVSARTPAGLRETAAALGDDLRRHGDQSVGDIAFTLATGRTHGRQRACIVAAFVDELLEGLDALAAGTPHGRVLTDANHSAPAHLADVTRRHLRGEDADWRHHFQGSRFHRVALPSTLEPRRHWRPATTVTPSTEQDAPLHPLLHRHQLNGPDIDIFESDFSASTVFELGEHIVKGSHVLVGTAWVEMVITASKRLFEAPHVVLQNVHYLEPLITFGDETRRVQLVISRVSDDTHRFSTRSAEVGTEDWRDHVRGEVVIPTTSATPERIDTKKLLDGFRTTDGPVVYEPDLVHTAGEYWNSSQEFWYSESGDSIILRFGANEATRAKKAPYSFFPPIADSSLNLTLFLTNEPYLPLSFGKAEIFCTLPDEGYAWMSPSKRTDLVGKGVLSSNVKIFTMDGQLVAHFHEYSVGKLSDTAKFSRAEEPHFHTLDWQAATTTDASFDTTHVIADRAALPAGWSERLDEAAARVHDVSTTADIERAVAEAVAAGADRVVHVHSQDHGFEHLYTVARAALASRWPASTTLTLITTSGQRVEADDVVDPTAHAAAAMWLSLAGENPTVEPTAVDVSADPAYLAGALALTGHRRLHALRSGAWFERSVRPVAADALGNDTRVRPGTVLVTGGTGGMAGAVTRHLLHQPGVRVALLSRSLDGTLDDLRRSGSGPNWIGSLPEDADTRVTFFRTDLSNEQTVSDTIAKLVEQHGPLVGAIHTAGAPGDGFLLNKEWDTFDSVLAPKVTGTENLLAALDGHELDFITLCSSMTATFGAPGQSDYAAANGYLDGTALRLAAAGKPARSLAWTGWSESGMAHNHGIDGSGFRSHFVDDATGAKWMIDSSGGPAGHLLVGIFDADIVRSERDDLEQVMDVQALQQHAPARHAPKQPRRDTSARPFESLTVMGIRPDNATEVQRAVCEAWATALGVDEVEANQPFFEAGGNSLLASRLQVLVDARYPNTLSIVDLFVHDTVSKISDHIAGQLPKPRQPAEAPAAAPSPTTTTRRKRRSTSRDRLSAMLDDVMADRAQIENLFE